MKPEAAIQRLIIDWLSVERIWHRRMNSGATVIPSARGNRFIRYGSVGMADILATFQHKGRLSVVWIEVKAPKGVQSEAQAMFEEEVQEQGHVYLLARSLDDVTQLFDDLRSRA